MCSEPIVDSDYYKPHVIVYLVEDVRVVVGAVAVATVVVVALA